MNREVDMIAFDLDGVLADTEPLHKLAKERILSEIGCPVELDLDAFVGLPNSEMWRTVLEGRDDGQSIEALERRQYDYILEEMRARNTPPSRGLPELLATLEAAGIRAGICSSSDRYYVDKVLSFLGLTGRFSPIVAGDMVERKKPAPDGYLMLIREAAIPPARIVALEDSRAGIAAAQAAGLRCIGYENPTSGQQNLGKADYRVRALAEIAEILER